MVLDFGKIVFLYRIIVISGIILIGYVFYENLYLEKALVNQIIPVNFLPSNYTYLRKNNVITKEVQDLLRLYPIETDPYYVRYEKELDKWLMKLKDHHDNPNKYELEIKNLPQKGNSCFSKVDIPAKTVIGDYRGIVTTEIIQDYKYAWYFLPKKSNFAEDHPLQDVMIDSTYYGDGWLR